MQAAEADEDHEPEPERKAGGATRYPARGHPCRTLRDPGPATRTHAQVYAQCTLQPDLVNKSAINAQFICAVDEYIKNNLLLSYDLL